MFEVGSGRSVSLPPAQRSIGRHVGVALLFGAVAALAMALDPTAAFARTDGEAVGGWRMRQSSQSSGLAGNDESDAGRVVDPTAAGSALGPIATVHVDSQPTAFPGALGGTVKIHNDASFTINFMLACQGGGNVDRSLAPGATVYYVCFSGNYMEVTWDNNPSSAIHFVTSLLLFGESLAFDNTPSDIPLFILTEGRLFSHDSRFATTISWYDFVDNTGIGRVVPFQTQVTGFLSFDKYDPNDFQILAKVINGCGAFGNNRWWVFAGGATNLYVTVAVVDRDTGFFRVYFNPLGAAFEAITDTDAFNTCF